MICLDEIVIDESLFHGVRELNAREYSALRDSILGDGEFFDSVLVWHDGEDYCLVDGRARIKIWNELDDDSPVHPPQIKEINVDGRNSAISWIKHRQHARRNLNVVELSQLPFENIWRK